VVVAGDEREHAQDDASPWRRHQYEVLDEPPTPRQGPPEQELVRQHAAEAVGHDRDRLPNIEPDHALH
jgi:hypothetical protein